MKKVRNLSLVAVVALGMMSCSDEESVNGKVALGFGASTGSASQTNARSMSTVVFDDFKINIREIEFEFAESEMEDDQATATNSVYTDDVKLKGPFVLDLLDHGSTVENLVATVDVPNAVYEEVEFKFHKNEDPSSAMYGKSVVITGSIGGVPFEFWHDTDEEFEIDFEDAAQNLAIDGNALALTIEMKLDQLLSLHSGINWTEAKDGNGNGTIEIHPNDEDGNEEIADVIKDALEDISDLIDDHQEDDQEDKD